MFPGPPGCLQYACTLVSLEKDWGSFKGNLGNTRTGLFGQFWPYLALGLRLGPSGRTDGIKWWGKAVAFSCLTRGKIGIILTELCVFTFGIYFEGDL